MNNKLKKRDISIDVAKVICAFLVLFLHTINLNVPYDNAVYNMIAIVFHKITWAINPVEFFFVVSGYFLFKKGLSKKNLLHYLKRLCILYLFWSLFYVGSIIHTFQSVNSVGTFFAALIKVFRRVLLIGTGGHMWYVLALIYGLLILYPLIAKKKVVIAWIISIGFYLINLAGDPYFHIFDFFPAFQKILSSINVFLGSMYLFRGFIFIMAGYYLANNKKKLCYPLIVILWVAAAAINNTELYFIKLWGTGIQYSVTLFKPITAVLFSMVVINLKLEVGLTTRTVLLAKYSTVVYFLHVFLRDLMTGFIIDMYVMWIVIAIICALFTIFMYLAETKLKWDWLKIIY